MILAAFVYTELLEKLVIKRKVKKQAEILIHRVKMTKRWSNYSLKSQKNPHDNHLWDLWQLH